MLNNKLACLYYTKVKVSEIHDLKIYLSEYLELVANTGESLFYGDLKYPVCPIKQYSQLNFKLVRELSFTTIYFSKNFGIHRIFIYIFNFLYNMN